MSEENKLDEKLLEILACPACKSPVHQEGDWIVCSGCGKRYPIREGIPIMLIDEAEEAGAEADAEKKA